VNDTEGEFKRSQGKSVLSVPPDAIICRSTDSRENGWRDWLYPAGDFLGGVPSGQNALAFTALAFAMSRSTVWLWLGIHYWIACIDLQFEEMAVVVVPLYRRHCELRLH
jgi:hypothetical protein